MNLLRKDGSPTEYGLSCGYVDRDENGPVRVDLWKEHGTYHVRRFNFETGARIWLSYPRGELGKARAKHRELVLEGIAR